MAPECGGAVRTWPGVIGANTSAAYESMGHAMQNRAAPMTTPPVIQEEEAVAVLNESGPR